MTLILLAAFITTACSDSYQNRCWTQFSKINENVSQKDLVGTYRVDHFSQEESSNYTISDVVPPADLQNPPSLSLRDDGSFAIYNFQGNEFAWRTAGTWPDSISGKWFLIGTKPGEELMLRLSVERTGFRDLYSESYLLRKDKEEFVIIDVRGNPVGCKGFVFRSVPPHGNL